ncbi:lipopolysaccharide biosynthesis protein [Croceicoccus sp. F390]|uniref:Lipopolysaccharide biosynthesis protein n=1 Tax=Croceicoccus esteveae TaxID=3075597 RepID=A0ABU2ZHQ5_9SPHN|nr:lipopolysaccharide biosynthesis protein [Croceicoccus sp. F390]MDT0575721.1 lipopolysaccharide biosynthesis protein [Croceicoccus sp. F390]
MSHGLRQLRHSRLARNIGALGYGQLAQVAGQLLAVPVFATVWGLETYGVWLLLFTIPSYLAISDLGLTSAATNDMIMTRAAGNHAQCVMTYRTMRGALLLAGGIVLIVAALLLFLLAPGMLAFAQAATGGHAAGVAMLLVGYGACSLQMNGIIAGLRASDRWAQAGLAYTSVFVAETILAIAAVLLGAGLVQVALCYLGTRAAALPLFALWLRSAAPELVAKPASGRAEFSVAELRRLGRPALAALALPTGFALSLQGSVAIVGALAGVAAVPVFTAVRTLTRLGVQMTNMVSSAAMPVFSIASATGARTRQAALLILSLGTCGVVLIPAFFVLSLFGRSIVSVWTGGVVKPEHALVVTMAAVMACNGTWMALSNMLLSVNRHAGYAVFYLAMCLVSLALAWLMTGPLGVVGAALALVVLDGAMLLRLIIEVRRASLFSKADFRAAWRDLRVRARELVGAG